MKLKDYLYFFEIEQKAFAAKLGICRGTLSYIVHEKQGCSKRIAMLIEEATNGRVKAKDLTNTKKKKHERSTTKFIRRAPRGSRMQHGETLRQGSERALGAKNHDRDA